MKTKAADSVAAAYLRLLADRGVEYLFGNAGTDFAPIVEAYAHNKEVGGATLPTPPAVAEPVDATPTYTG